MKTILTTSLIFLSTVFGFSQADHLFDYVPLIKARDSQLGIDETGSGLMVGYEENRIYIATAYHVVAGMNEISLAFRGDRNTYPAILVQHDRELDLAILYISAKLNVDALDLVTMKMEEGFSRGEAIISIGHPFGESWQLNDRNILLEPKDNQDPRLVTITPEAIVPGCSGGPVFDLKDGLVGLILRENEINAPCVRAYTIKKKLNDWQLPSNLILSTEEWWDSLTPAWKSILQNQVRASIRNRNENKAGGRIDVSPVQFFLELFATTVFECSNCDIQDIKPLERLTKVRELVVKNNYITDLEPLRKMKQLQYLDLRNNDVYNLEPLSQLYDLETIILKKNRSLYDLSPLQNLVNLKSVDLTKTNIRSMMPLAQLYNLELVKLFLTDVPTSQLRLFRRQLPKTKFRFRTKREGIAHLIHVLSNPRTGDRKMEEINMQEQPESTNLITPVYQPTSPPLAARPDPPAKTADAAEPVYSAAVPEGNSKPETSSLPASESVRPAPAPTPVPAEPRETDSAGTARLEASAEEVVPAAPVPADPVRASVAPQNEPDAEVPDLPAGSVEQAVTSTTPDRAPAPAAVTEPVEARPQTNADPLTEPEEDVMASTDAAAPRETVASTPPAKTATAASGSQRDTAGSTIERPQPSTQKEVLPTRDDSAGATPEKAVSPEPPAASAALSTAAAYEIQIRKLLLEGDPKTAESKAFEGLGKDPEDNLYRVYIVLGRVYQGNYEKARQLWFLFQNRSLRDGQNFSEKVLAEIQQLEDQGVSSGTVKKFKALLRNR